MEDERYSAAILNAILGGDVNSRLFQGIREKHGLTYSVYSYGSSFSDVGLMHIYAAMNPQQYDKVYELVVDIINDLRQKGVKSIELENAKKQTMVEMTLNRDSTSSVMSANAKNIMYGIPITSFEERIAMLNGVKRKDVNNLIDKYLTLDNMSMGFIGPI